MEVREIPISEIVIPEQRARATFTPEQMEELRASIEKNGFTIPILVRPLPDGRFELIDGEHRIQIVSEMGWDKVPAVITDADDKKATLLNVLANTARGTQNPMDVAEALKRAQEAGATIDELAAATGHTKSWVKLYLTLNELPDNYKQALREGRLKVGHIQEAMKLNDPVEIDAALQSVLVHGWSVSVLKYYVEQRLAALQSARDRGDVEFLEHPPTPDEAQEYVQYGECMFCHRKVPRDQLRMPVICEDCYQLLAWIIDQIGPPREAMQTIYNAVNMYYDFLRKQKEEQQMIVQQSQPAQQPAQQAQGANSGLDEEEEKVVRLIKALKSAGVI